MIISQQKITPRISDLLTFNAPKEEILRDFIPKHYLYWTSSARDALREILLRFRGKKVGIPAYTCYVVLDALKSAGAFPIFYDSSVVCELSDIKKIITKVDLLIVSYNFGYLPEINKISRLCKRHRVLLIEDCAQALGAEYKGKLAGSFGDFAIYSFGISKNIGFRGGLLASKEQITISKKRKMPKALILKSIIEVITSPFFFSLYIYPLTRNLLRGELNKKQEQLNYFLPEFAKKVVLNQFKKYPQILRKRRRNAQYFLSHISKNILLPKKSIRPSFIYLVIFGNDVRQKELLKKGIELGRMRTFRALSPMPKAKKAENEVLTFALYRQKKEIKQIVKKINEITKND